MGSFIGIIASLFIYIGLFVLFPVWLVWGRKIKGLRNKVAELDRRLAALDRQATEPQALEPEPPAPQPARPEAAAGPIAALPERESEVAETRTEAPLTASRIPSVPSTASRIPSVTPAARAPEAAAPEEAAGAPWRPSAVKALLPQTRQRVTALVKERGVGQDDWETLIGGRWLNKIGIVLLVIGIALFLGYSLRYWGPAGKAATGLVTSLALLVGGVFLERVPKYSLFAKPIIGGGWALLYFTAYAAHNVEAAKVIQQPAWGLLVLGLVAAGMILHSLKFRSQIVTGFAYVLGFLAVAISPLNPFSLIASSILAASLIALLRRMPWYEIGLFGVAATYFNHILWLAEGMQEAIRVEPAEAFWVSQGIVVLYWLVFAAFAFVRRPQDHRQRQLALAIHGGNTLAFLAVSAWQVTAVFPDEMYVLAGAAGVAYAVMGYLLRATGRRTLHLFDGSVAIGLIALTLPLGLRAMPLSYDWLAAGWLIEAGFVLASGFYLKETVFRVEAYILSLAVVGALFAFNISESPAGRHGVLWATVAPAIAYLYYLFEQLRRWTDRGAVDKAESDVGVAASYAGTALLAALIWREMPAELVAPAWLAAGLVLFEFGVRHARVHLRLQ